MSEPGALMNEKEKKYVSTCFRKNVLYKKGAIDFERIFNDEKIVYDFQNVKRNAEEKFGKQTKRSRKYLRKSASTESNFMSEQFILVELLEMVSLIKFIVFDEENLEEMENAIVDYFKINFKKIINFSKSFSFLNVYFSVASSNHKFNILKFLIENIEFIDIHKELYEFLTNQNNENNGMNGNNEINGMNNNNNEMNNNNNNEMNNNNNNENNNNNNENNNENNENNNTYTYTYTYTYTNTIDIPENIFDKISGYTVAVYLLRSNVYKKEIYDLFLTKKIIYNIYLEELISLLNKSLKSKKEKNILKKTVERIEDIRVIDLLKRLII